MGLFLEMLPLWIILSSWLSEWETPDCVILHSKARPLSTYNERNPQPHPGSDSLIVLVGNAPFCGVNLWIHVSPKAQTVVNVGSNCRHSKFTLLSHMSLEAKDHQSRCHLKGWPRFHSHFWCGKSNLSSFPLVRTSNTSLNQISICWTAVVFAVRASEASTEYSLIPFLLFLPKAPCPFPIPTTSKGKTMRLDVRKCTENQGQCSHLCIPRAPKKDRAQVTSKDREFLNYCHTKKTLVEEECGGRCVSTQNFNTIALFRLTVLQSKQPIVFQRLTRLQPCHERPDALWKHGLLKLAATLEK